MEFIDILESAQGVLIADVRKSLAGFEVSDGVYFVIKKSNSGPMKLLWLGMDLDTAANDVASTKTTLAVKVSQFFQKGSPKVIRWALGAFYDIPAAAAYLILVKNGEQKVRKLGRTTTITKQGTIWRGKKKL